MRVGNSVVTDMRAQHRSRGWRPAKPRDYTAGPFHQGRAHMKTVFGRLVATLVVTSGALLLAGAAQAQAQNSHKLTQLWESDASLKVPESVRFDAKRKVLYVSNIDGEPWAADGKGSIAKVGLDGKIIAAEWVTGLDCPKGLALSDDGKWLYAADAGGIVVIDVDAGKIKN